MDMPSNNLVTKTFLKKELTELEHRLETNLDKKMSNRLRRLEDRIIKKLNIIAEFFDKPVLDHEKRIGRIEDHLGLPKMASQN